MTQPIAAAQTYRVLLVEDDDVDATSVRRMLRKQTEDVLFEVTRVHSVSEAVELLSSVTFDVIVSDITLPDCDGLQSVQRLQAVASNVAIVVLSGREDADLALTAIRAGAQDFLIKGVTTGNQLRRSLRYSHDRKQTVIRLLRMAHHDPLTGLANRRASSACLTRLIHRYARLDREFSVLYLDLDGFKLVNDTHGHDVGDALLVQVAARLQACLREYDHCARLGGDEFLIVVDGVDGKMDHSLMARRVVAKLQDPFEIDDVRLSISVSVGVAVFPMSGADEDELIRRADQCLFKAKRAGRNRFHLADEANAAHVSVLKRSA